MVAITKDAKPSGTGDVRPVSLDDRYELESGRILVSGTQALIRLPIIQRRRDLAAGLNTAGYVSGYRGSPLAGFDREMARAGKYLKDSHIHFQPGLNEDMAATAVWGTQQTAMFEGARYDGVFAMWYGKGPGVDRSMDVIRHANAVGTNPNGGVLLLVGDDHGAVSSTLPHQSEHNLISAMVPLLSPAGVAEYIDYGLLGWAMSRYSGAWVGFKGQTEIVESSASVEVSPDKPAIIIPDRTFAPDGLSLRWPDGPHEMERRLELKLEAAKAFARANALDRAIWQSPRGKARLGIVSTGKSWLDLLSALDLLGIDELVAQSLGVRLYKVGMVWPLETEGMRAFAGECERLLIVEEKRSILEEQIKDALYNMPADKRPAVFGKAAPDGSPLLPARGEIDALSVARAVSSLIEAGDTPIRQRLAERESAIAGPLASHSGLTREPYFCSGCPHSVSTRLPEGSRATTGIGCHMMVIGLEERRTSTFTQMGGEGGGWIGLSPFTDEKHVFANMGDGTYFHSGILAIRASIAARVNTTYKILYNDAVAMTGGQRHDGDLTVPAIIDQVRAEGAVRVAVVAENPDVWRDRLPAGVSLSHRDEMDAVQRELRDIKGVSVLIYDQVCAAEKRRRRKKGQYPVSQKRAFINELVCEGCGDCSAVSNCISIEPQETEFGRKRRINQSSCNTDLSCVKGFCPSFVIVEGGTLRKPKAKIASFDVAALPQPPIRADLDKSYNILLTGIGGTGVITVSAVLAMAAHIDGLALQTLDQTGLAQKNGAVVSHLKLARATDQLASVRIGSGESDLVLGFDIVVAASAKSLPTFSNGRTRAVIDDYFAPTASFVKNTAIDFRKEATLKSISHAAGEDALTLVSSSQQATALFGDAIASNMFLLGHAWQKGLVPISLAAIDQAIELNGTAIAMNRSAFNWGRRSAVEPEAVRAAATPAIVPPAPAASLEEMIETRRLFLTAYQNSAYAGRYIRLVETARASEARLTTGTDFAEAVARNAFKLMAYKDEYEVARLLRDKTMEQKLHAQFEGDFKITHLLAPPALSRTDPRTGHPAKIAFGPWIRPALGLLARLKFLRGTVIDPFGRTTERRMERRLVDDYFGMIAMLSDRLDTDIHANAVSLAQLPQKIRGFGHVKMASVADYEHQKNTMIASISQETKLHDVA